MKDLVDHHTYQLIVILQIDGDGYFGIIIESRSRKMQGASQRIKGYDKGCLLIPGRMIEL